MKAQELRIGNWVIYNDRPYRVDKVEAVCVSAMGDWFPCDDYSPIPLTSEILEKAGFVNNPDSDFNCIEISNHTYLSCGDNTVWIDRQVKSELYSVGLGGAEHLHQLQNLYHALTGEELDIEL